MREGKQEIDNLRQTMAGITPSREEEEAKGRGSRRLRNRDLIETDTAADQDESLRQYELHQEEEDGEEGRGSEHKRDRPRTLAIDGDDYMTFEIPKTLTKQYEVRGGPRVTLSVV